MIYQRNIFIYLEIYVLFVQTKLLAYMCMCLCVYVYMCKCVCICAFKDVLCDNAIQFLLTC